MLSTVSGVDKGEGKFYRDVLTRLGCKVGWIFTAAPRKGETQSFEPSVGLELGTSLEDVIRFIGFSPDLFLYIEPLGIIPSGIERAPFPTACILCDTHRDLKSRQKLSRFFDHVFLYHRNYISAFNEHPDGYIHWFPYSCDLKVFRPLGMKRDLDVAFIGQLFSDNSERARIMKHLGKRWKINEQRYYPMHEIPVVYSRAKIVVNLPLADDLNFRFFEGLSCRALLLTRRIKNGQEILFKEGTHYVAFNTEQELYEKVNYYLKHDTEREKIAAAGHAEFMARHRLDIRLKSLLEEVSKKPNNAAPVRHMTLSELDRQYAWLYEYWRSVDAGLRLVADARNNKRQWVPLVLPAVRSFLRAILS